MKDSINRNNNNYKDNKYDKIRHLVEVDDDILAVFSLVSDKIEELYIAENSNLDKSYIDSLIRYGNLIESMEIENQQTKTIKQKDNEFLGKLKWIVFEYENLRILKIYELDKFVFVLIKSNTQLAYTVDNILGYYYDLDEIPKSLF